MFEKKKDEQINPLIVSLGYGYKQMLIVTGQ